MLQHIVLVSYAAGLRKNIEAAGAKIQSANTKVYDKVRSKMSSKYGQFSHTADWKKKGIFG